VAQYEDRPLIVYNQDRWVAIANYQQWETADLVNLWYLLNKQAVEIIKNTKPEMARRQCLAGEPQTIEWLAADYIKHLRHHIHQVLDLDAVAYP